jgi:hypothetical protein
VRPGADVGGRVGERAGRGRAARPDDYRAAIGLIQERALRERNLLAAQLQAALNSRVIIEQAKGMIAQYLTVTVDDAFQLLRNYAHYHNRKLSEVASDVVERRIPSVALGRPHGQQS